MGHLVAGTQVPLDFKMIVGSLGHRPLAYIHTYLQEEFLAF